MGTDPLATIGAGAIAPEISDQARERARRLVEAETELVGLRAQVAYLTEELESATWARDTAEQALLRVEDFEQRRVFVPGGDEPEDVEVVVALHDGQVFVRRSAYHSDHPWQHLTASGSGIWYDWRGLDDYAPLVDVTGYGSKRFVSELDEERSERLAMRSAIWTFERDALAPHFCQEFEIERDRERAGSVAEFQAILKNATMMIYRASARIRSGQPFSETTDETLARQGADVESARSIAVRLEGELAALREALSSIHVPKAVGSSDPEDPTIICQACRTDFPCETRSFMDALDPKRELDEDEFAGQPDPF